MLIQTTSKEKCAQKLQKCAKKRKVSKIKTQKIILSENAQKKF